MPTWRVSVWRAVAVRPVRHPSQKTAADSSYVQFWLLGYEFPTTLMLFTLDTIYILTTQKKGSLDPPDPTTPIKHLTL